MLQKHAARPDPRAEAVIGITKANKRNLIM